MQELAPNTPAGTIAAVLRHDGYGRRMHDRTRARGTSGPEDPHLNANRPDNKDATETPSTMKPLATRAGGGNGRGATKPYDKSVRQKRPTKIPGSQFTRKKRCMSTAHDKTRCSIMARMSGWNVCRAPPGILFVPVPDFCRSGLFVLSRRPFFFVATTRRFCHTGLAFRRDDPWFCLDGLCFGRNHLLFVSHIEIGANMEAKGCFRQEFASLGLSFGRAQGHTLCRSIGLRWARAQGRCKWAGGLVPACLFSKRRRMGRSENPWLRPKSDAACGGGALPPEADNLVEQRCRVPGQW